MARTVKTHHKAPVHKPAPPPPNTTVATQWPLYRLYPPGPEWSYSQAAPTSQEPSKGYDIEASRLEPSRRRQLANQANGLLLDGPNGYTFTMFVQKFGLDLSLGGSYGQSQYTRDFYPRNFVQPHVTVQGQSPSQEEYGMLCEFVHSCQHKAIANGFQNLTQLFIAGRDKTGGLSGRGFDGKRQDGTRVVINRATALMPGRMADPSGSPRGTYYSQTIRGSHQPFVAKGYISTMQRAHRQFQYAVTWTMVFTIAAILQGPFGDTGGAQNLSGQAPNTWLTMLQDIQKTGVTTSTAQLIKQNEKIVRAASTATINPVAHIIPNSTTGSSSGTTGSSSTGSGSTTASPGGWITVGATIDPTQGQAPTFSAHGGFSFAELLQAGANRGLHPTLTETLGLSGGTYGMAMETAILVRMPNSNRQFKIYKNDVGSGQARNAHYKVDLHQGIANALGWSPNQDIQVKVA